jgi:Gamma-glutamylcysteine synthetase
VSRFGYSSALQRKHTVSYNSLEGYIKDIRTLLGKKSRKYGRLGMYNNGVQIQMNTNILQRDSEYYSSIRFKQVVEEGETQIEALEKRGIKYLELRVLDINPFEKAGVSLNQLRFMHVFVLYCLFSGGELIEADEYKIINDNHNKVALFGRKVGLKLHTKQGEAVSLREWAAEIFQALNSIAQLIDEPLGEKRYTTAVQKEYEKLLNTELLPAAKNY